MNRGRQKAFSSLEAAIHLASAMDRDLWPAPIFSPRFTDFRLFCAVSCFYQNGRSCKHRSIAWGAKFWTGNSKFQRHHIGIKIVRGFKAVSNWEKRFVGRITYWLWEKFDLPASATCVQFYELRSEIQRPKFVCACHFAIKCSDSWSNFKDEKGSTECLCFKRRSLNWRWWPRRSEAENAPVDHELIVVEYNIRPHFYISWGRSG